MERLSIASFLASGHEYHLYAYDQIKNVPKGVILRAAEEILPRSMIFKYRTFPSYAGFANFFRYKLLLKKGGWWVDMDLVCLKPFAFADSYVFSSERLDGRNSPTNAVIKVPAGSDIMAFNWDLCQSCPDPSGLRWGEYGPRLMESAIAKFELEAYIKEPEVFCPIDFLRWKALLQPVDPYPCSASTYSVHLWNEMWRRSDRDKNAPYAPGCLYEQFKGAFLSRCSRGPWGTFLSRCADGLWRARRRWNRYAKANFFS